MFHEIRFDYFNFFPNIVKNQYSARWGKAMWYKTGSGGIQGPDSK